MTEPPQANAVPAHVPRYEAPSDTPDAPPDPYQASLQRAQRGYQTGWSSPWADDAIRDEAEVESVEAPWQPPAAERGRKGLAGLFRRCGKDASAAGEGPRAEPAAGRGVPETAAPAAATQPPIQPGPRRMAPDSADSAV